MSNEQTKPDKGELLVPNIGAGSQIRERLCKELGIPKEAKWFEVRFAVGELVTVRVEYFPRDHTEG